MTCTPLLAVFDLSLVEQLVYMASAFFFVTGLKKLTKVKTARAGNRMASMAMLVAVVMTVYLVVFEGDLAVSLPWLVGGLLLGGAIGVFLAKKVEMTEMPELVAFFNGMGGASSMFVALSSAVFLSAKLAADATFSGGHGADIAISIGLSILVGSVTLTGSLVAYAKLSGKMWKNRFGPVGSQGLNILLVVLAVGLVVFGGFLATGTATSMTAFLVLALVALFLGVGLVVPIGGADMPVVISLLNSYSGIAAAMTGFILHNNLLIVAGMLVGAAGLILTQIMCKAMNRSLANVLFAKFGEEDGAKGDTEYTGVTSTSAEELAPLLEAAEKV
ncbi:MAG: NAD(P)(+) transhydrogenase (Re/Si-specific) subunit beta, partial [Planctomycetota bacterium]|nr:NAD(P)(+) transhydrogenase (Re/Si-specific) subunit beta [Planctomycetota bacterium]